MIAANSTAEGFLSDNASSGFDSSGTTFCVFVLILLFALSKSLSALLQKIPQPLVQTFLGIAFGLLLSWLGATGMTTTLGALFENIFMFFLLPAVLFSTTLSFNRRLFFANIKLILLLAFVGTLVSILAFFAFLVAMGRAGFSFSPPPHYLLVFAVIISSTDTVGVLGALGDSSHARFQTVLTGESLLNDLVIVAFFRRLVMDEAKPLVAFAVDVALTFLCVLVFSALAGLAGAVVAQRALGALSARMGVVEACLASTAREAESFDCSRERLIKDESRPCAVEDDARENRAALRSERETIIARELGVTLLVPLACYFFAEVG